MNILRLVQAEKDKKNKPPSTEFKKLEDEATSNYRDRVQFPIRIQKVELRKTLTPVQFHVTQERGTERGYSGKYLRTKDDGLYSCVVCENPLFSSDEKYDSHCGWPAFRDVIAQGKVTCKRDASHGVQRVEIACSQCGSHIGHVFDDGPKEKPIRYCVNSCALNFKRHTTV